MPLSAATYERIVLEDGDHKWELHRGRLVEKPTMTFQHNDVGFQLAVMLSTQLPRMSWHVVHDSGKLNIPNGSYYIPDVFVVPRSLSRAQYENRDNMESYSDPATLVVEVWSPSTGRYDIRAKLPDYQSRGDLEIWFLHPYYRTLTRWIHQADGTYTETTQTGGTVQPLALPGVTINLDDLFELP